MIDVRAVITTKFAKGYKPVDVSTVVDYYIDSAMDTDTDSFNIVIGDDKGELREVMGRDNEVRVNIYGIGTNSVEALHMGFVDEASLTEENLLTLSGRDMTSVATDTQALPGKWTNVRPKEFIEKRARALQMGARLNLESVKPFKLYTSDGTESEWELWYRLYRKRQKWMWAEADGTLNAGPLKYGDPVSYYFGPSTNPKYIPVDSIEWRANKQQRVWEVFIFGHTGQKGSKAGFVASAKDPNLSQWIRKRVTISTDPNIHSQAAARAEALEELFESAVGSVEIKLVVAHPGYIIRQNRMAHVNLPTIDLAGDFFVVGSRILGNTSEGLFQEVRLREKQYAISKRVPPDPRLSGPPDASTATSAGTNLSGIRWSGYFVEAATKYAGPWPFQVFLTVLISICDKETGFRNERRGSSIEYPDNPPNSVVQNTFPAFAEKFANEAKYGRVKEDFAVGPMQLLTAGYKEAADKMGGGFVDELYGNRWNPRWNIMESAAVLREKLKASGVEHGDITTVANAEDFIWQGVGLYYGGSKAANAAYAADVKSRYDNNFKSQVVEAVQIARAQQSDSAIAEGVFYSPVRQPWKNLGGPSDHLARKINDLWESNNAQDLGVSPGTPVFACCDGVISPKGTPFDGYGISKSEISTVYGYRLHLASSNTDNVFFYQHLAPNLVVAQGKKVRAGQVLGYVGDYRANGIPTHLHFAAYHGNPTIMVKGAPDVPLSRNT